VRFSALNVVDVGSHLAGTEVVQEVRPPRLAEALVGTWERVGIPEVCQLDNHSNFRGGIPPAAAHFGPVVATCLDLGVTPRFIPLSEPWRNGVVEHFNDVWDKSFFRTMRFTDLDHLRREARGFEEFHNTHHRYAAHRGKSPLEVVTALDRRAPPGSCQIPTDLPLRGKVEVVRYTRSRRLVDLFGHQVTVAPEHTYRYVVATIWVPEAEVVVATRDGEIIHQGRFPISRELR